MATNWTAAEAVKILIEGKDQEAIQDITKRFPLTAIAVAKGDMQTLASVIPEKVSMRKLEMGFKCEDDSDDQDEEEVAEEKPAKEEKIS